MPPTSDDKAAGVDVDFDVTADVVVDTDGDRVVEVGVGIGDFVEDVGMFGTNTIVGVVLSFLLSPPRIFDGFSSGGCGFDFDGCGVRVFLRRLPLRR